MKLDDVIIFINFIFLLLIAMIGIENPVFAQNRIMMAITMDLCLIFGFIGYWIGEKEEKQIRQKQKILEKYLEEWRIKNENTSH